MPIENEARKVFADNIRRYSSDKHIAQIDIATRLGVSTATVSEWFKGKKYPRPEKMQKLADMFGIKVSDLQKDESERKSAPKNDIDLFAIPGILPMPKMVRKPLIGTIACGTPILAEQNVDKYISVPEDIRCDFVLRCEGDSMIGAHIMPGASVYIREQQDVENGDIAAVIVDDERATLKKVYKTDSAITLLAENPAYPPIIITGERLNHVRILGSVVAWTNYL